MSTSTTCEGNVVSMFCALVIKGAVEQSIAPAFRAIVKKEIVTEFDPTSVLMERIKSGARADVIVAIDRNIDELIEADIVSARHRIPLVRTGVGIAVRAGAAKPEISSVQEFKQSLLDARSIAYSRTGASGIYFATLIKKLGIAEAVNARASIIEKGLIAEALLTGVADIAVQQLSELATVAGVDLVGPLPAEIQQYTDFSAALFSSAVDKKAAVQLLSILSSGDARREYLRFGLEIR
jgi:molybdate transport system substrate-binding protein